MLRRRLCRCVDAPPPSWTRRQDTPRYSCHKAIILSSRTDCAPLPSKQLTVSTWLANNSGGTYFVSIYLLIWWWWCLHQIDIYLAIHEWPTWTVSEFPHDKKHEYAIVVDSIACCTGNKCLAVSFCCRPLRQKAKSYYYCYTHVWYIRDEQNVCMHT